MIYTSYFDKLKSGELPDNITPISICGRAPEWYTGLQYKKLAPKLKFFNEWLENKDNEFYTREYNKQVLKHLVSGEVVYELFNLLSEKDRILIEMVNCPPWSNPHVNIALICYEKPDEFCHRHLVREWLNSDNITCTEWGDE